MAPVQYTGALQPKKKVNYRTLLSLSKLAIRELRMNFRSVSRSTSTTTLNSRTIQVFQGCMADVNAVSNHNPLCMYIVYHIIHSSDTTWSARAEPVPAEQRVGRRVGPLEPIPAVITTPTKGTIQVSPPLVHAISPIESTPRHSLQPVSEKVVLPPSSPVSPVKSIIQMSADIAAKVQEIDQIIVAKNCFLLFAKCVNPQLGSPLKLTVL